MQLLAHAGVLGATGARGIVCLLLTIYYFILFASVILTWIPRPPDAIRPVVDVINAVTQPVFRLVRPLIPPIRAGGIALDLSALVVFILLILLQQAIC